MPSSILLIGATGGTGRHVASLLQERQIPARWLVRDLARGREVLGDGDFWVGDVLHDDLESAFAGVTSVICALGSREPNGLRLVDLPAIQRLVEVARKQEIRRFVLCSTIGAVPTPGVPEHLLQAFAPKGEAEQALRESGVPFTIIRPGRLDGPLDEPRAIERSKVAVALVEALFRPDAENAIYELSEARFAKEGADAKLGLRVQ